ncbi:MAG: hypothetical protein GXN92_02415 [Candidatus Micrarchaeota archaeon]|nr:hypothetical protein [Candidatus Micrarchaeota archaeon]
MAVVKTKEPVDVELLNKLGFPTEEENGEYWIEITPNRPDLLSITGIKRFLALQKGEKPRKYYAQKWDIEFINKKPSLRPYIEIGLAQLPEPSPSLIEELIDLQEKIHETFGRKRKKIAIGIHDYGKIKPPIIYEEVKEERFVPLGWDREASIEEILNEHEKGIAYRHLVKEGHYPMLKDSLGVLSFPPIINSERTKITEETTQFFIDITGTNPHALLQTLNILLALFQDHGAEVWAYNPQAMKYYEIEAPSSQIESLIGFQAPYKELLQKSGIEYDGQKAIIPPYRVDFMDWTDVAEEVAINYGYENITPQEYFVPHYGKVREEPFIDTFLRMGFREVHTWFLGDKNLFKEYYDNVQEIQNPLTEQFNSLRPGLEIPLLEMEARNKREPFPHETVELGKIYNNGERWQLGFLIGKDPVKVEDYMSVFKTLAQEEKLPVKITEENKNPRLFLDEFAYSGRIGEYDFWAGIVKPEVLERFGIDYGVALGVIDLK